ncbi:MAG TPA: rRNA maturation RNase YbeY [Thermoguttaceae bacterium]|nr:rRNA maturation RNase YbeY [Thermoguttaceae bacterium]
MIKIEIANRQSHVVPDENRLKKAVRTILREASISNAEISLALVDDATIARLHEKYLGLDEPTDVLSFVLERSDDRLEGEVIVSAETAALTSTWYGWEAKDELLLYVIHGTLHLVGYDDTTPEKKAEMRRQEDAYLTHFGVSLRAEEPPASPPTVGEGGDEDS